MSEQSPSSQRSNAIAGLLDDYRDLKRRVNDHDDALWNSHRSIITLASSLKAMVNAWEDRFGLLTAEQMRTKHSPDPGSAAAAADQPANAEDTNHMAPDSSDSATNTMSVELTQVKP